MPSSSNFINRFKSPVSDKRPASSAVVPTKSVTKDMDKLSRALFPLRATSLPVITQHVRRTLSLSRTHTPKPSKNANPSLAPTPLCRSTTSASKPSVPITHSPRPLSDSFPRAAKANLRSFFAGRHRTRRNTVDSVDTEESLPEIEEDLETSMTPLSASCIHRKSHVIYDPELMLSRDINGSYFSFHPESSIPSRYPVTDPFREEEPLGLDTLFPPREFDDDEDTSEPEEEDVSLMKELILGKIDFRM